MKRIIKRLHARSEALLMDRILPVPQHYLAEFGREAAAFGKSQVMLDLGGGDGSLTKHLSSQARMRIVLDIDFGTRPDVVADGHHLPLRGSSVDYVVCIEVLEHCAYPAQFLSESARVMQTGALLQLTTRQYWRTHGSPNDFFRYTEQGLRRLLTDAGFTEVRCRPMGGPFTVIGSVWDQFCGQVGLGRPLLKQIFVYPVWIIATILDRFVMRTRHFRSAPDTTGWRVTAKRS